MSEAAATSASVRATQDRARIWNSMRVLRSFSRQELVSTAEAQPSNVRQYVLGLVRGGYVKALTSVDRGKKGGGAEFQLIRDTGPVAPRISHRGVVDPNLLDPYGEQAIRHAKHHSGAMLKLLRETVDELQRKGSIKRGGALATRAEQLLESIETYA